ncbi:hypothetical protein HYDPIDRAFT_28616 [Hydnomerulius pinastri MD-312]|uniref:Uncharacterized protein n=1 Tax=Hydnomerulius pinastri MD-312 TaxID=994086 RepID=A0A0C9WFH2_9AGAM|nr:hypothetical protein HYDPIDRAFT_28616 [Hydnomerulius pinastri MD-312]
MNARSSTIDTNLPARGQRPFQSGLVSDVSYISELRRGLQVTATDVKAAARVDEDPSKDMLHAEIDKLGLNDLVAIAENVPDPKLPLPPNDFLEFEKLQLRICLDGDTVKGITYHAGLSFESRMILFGIHVDVHALLTFELDATLIGDIGFRDLNRANFPFSAGLKQHIPDYIHDDLQRAPRYEEFAISLLRSGLRDLKKNSEATMTKALRDAEAVVGSRTYIIWLYR